MYHQGGGPAMALGGSAPPHYSSTGGPPAYHQHPPLAPSLPMQGTEQYPGAQYQQQRLPVGAAPAQTHSTGHPPHMPPAAPFAQHQHPPAGMQQSLMRPPAHSAGPTVGPGGMGAAGPPPPSYTGVGPAQHGGPYAGSGPGSVAVRPLGAPPPPQRPVYGTPPPHAAQQQQQPGYPHQNQHMAAAPAHSAAAPGHFPSTTSSSYHKAAGGGPPGPPPPGAGSSGPPAAPPTGQHHQPNPYAPAANAVMGGHQQPPQMGGGVGGPPMQRPLPAQSHFGPPKANAPPMPGAAAPPPPGAHHASSPPLPATSAASPYAPNAGTAVAPPGYRSYMAGNTGATSAMDPAMEAKINETLAMNPAAHFARATTLRLPNSNSVNVKAQTPLAVVFQPLSPIPEGHEAVPAVNFGTTATGTGKVIRCTRCRTYINPFVEWESNGRRWVCNLCSFANDTPQLYYCSLDENGRRTDWCERPELHKSTVEFVAPDDYMVRPPQPPAFFFLIDVSFASVVSGLLESTCNAIKDAIRGGYLAGGSRTEIAIATYDANIHFYNIDPSLSQPQMLIITELRDAFVPVPDGVFCLAQDAAQMVCGLLDMLPTMWRDQKISESCTGSAVKAAWVAMKHLGGKLLVFSSTLPQIGEGTLPPQRQQPPRPAKDSAAKEADCLRPSIPDYTEMAAYLSQAQISVDLYVCPPGSQNMELPTLAPLVSRSGGDLHFFPNFNAHLTGEKLRETVLHSLRREQGWEALVRFRVSKGWTINRWHGHFQLRRPDLLVIPCAHADQTFTVMLEMQDNVIPDPLVFIQGALLYTNSDGERRIRVHTFALAVTQHLSDIFAKMSIETVAYVIAQTSIDKCTTKSLLEGRAYAQSACKNLLQAAASEAAWSAGGAATNGGNPNNVELVAKLMPMYILGLLKSPLLQEAKDVSHDIRMYHWTRFASLPISTALALFAPRLYDLTNISSMPHEWRVVPDSLPLTAASMGDGGVYLIENGDCMLMWISRSVQEMWIRSVFGLDSAEQLQSEYSEFLIHSSTTDLGKRIAAIISELRSERRPTYMKLHVVRQGDPTEYKFFNLLIEDRSHALMMSYAEFVHSIAPRMASVMGGTSAAALPRVAHSAY